MNGVKKFIKKELSFILACPALLWQIFFLYIPFVILFGYSIVAYFPATQATQLTLKFYEKIISAIYFKIILNSFIVATLTSVLCLIIAYPVAYFLVTRVHRKRLRTLLVFSLILPSWTSIIIQIYAWIYLFNKNSVLSMFFYWTGLFSESFNIVNSYYAILIGMVSIYLPFMILPIYAVLEKMDKKLLEASADLGAASYQTFKRVIFPMSFPGVVSGVILVFLSSFGEFTIPSLLGGAKKFFCGSLIVEKFLISRDIQTGAALTCTTVFVPVLTLIVVWFFLRVKKKIKYGST